MEFEKLQGIIAEVLNIEPEEVTMAATFVETWVRIHWTFSRYHGN